MWPIQFRVFLTELTSKKSLQKRRRLVQNHTCVLFASAFNVIATYELGL